MSTAAAALGHDPAICLRTCAHLYPGGLRSAADTMDAVQTAAHNPKRGDRTGIVRIHETWISAVPELRSTKVSTKIHAGIARGRRFRRSGAGDLSCT
jgi:hypothetical protein